jgi:hypothetical protein
MSSHRRVGARWRLVEVRPLLIALANHLADKERH